MKPKEIKILFITPGCYDKGGISRYNRYQIQSLISIVGKENVRVLSLFGPGDDNLDDAFEVTWHGKKNGLGSKAGLLAACFFQCISWKPDLIWIGHVNFSGFSWLMAKSCGAKTVLDIYGLEVWGDLTRDAMYGFRKMDYVISDCHYTADIVEKAGIRPTGSTTVIWDCVDLVKFKPETEKASDVSSKYKLPNRADHFILMSLGRLSRDAAYKGYERLLRVFALVHRKFPNAKLIFAGRGDLIPDLKRIAQETGVEASVFFTGSVDESDMAAIYSYAHVFALISHRDKTSGEGIPLTPLEAMACGVPVLVGNHDGSQEAVKDNRNGFVLDPFDLADLEAKLIWLIENPDSRIQLGKEARMVAEEYFSYEIFKDQHRLFLERIQHSN